MKPHLPLKLRSALLAALIAVSYTVYTPAWAEDDSLTETRVYTNGTWSDRITSSKTLDDYELVDISNKSWYFRGGAIYLSSSSDKVTISNSGAVVFSENRDTSTSSNVYGGAIYNKGTISFTGNGGISFSGNYATSSESYGYGGAIYNEGTLSFTNNGDISFSENYSNYGAIYNSGTLSFTNNGDISFSGNHGSSGGAIYNEGTLSFTSNGDISFSENYSNYGAIYNSDTLSFTSNGDISFSGNYATFSTSSYGGGAIRNLGTLSFERNGDISFSGNYATSSKHYAYGGAIYNEDTLSFTNNGDISFSGNYATTTSSYYGYGGAIYNKDTLSFTGNGNISFSGNHGSSGGAIYNYNYYSYSYATLSFTGNGNISFSGNHGSSGGAIYNAGTISFTDNGDISFSGNYTSYSSYSYGGAIYNRSGGTISFSGNGDISFSGNYATTTSSYSSYSSSSYGGAIYNSSGTLSFERNGDISFSGNYASSSSSSSYGGAIYNYSGTLSFTGNGNISFSGNYASSSSYSYGGAIYNRSEGTISFTGNRDISFSGNYAFPLDYSSSFGGAIYNAGTISFTDNGDISFSGNYTSSSYSYYSSYGGAIYNSSGMLSFSGNGDIVFQGNFEKINKKLRSIYSYDGTVTLSATTGKSITFYDSIYTSSSATLELNKAYVDADGQTVAATGSIVFTGETTEADLAAAFARTGIAGTPTKAEILASRTSEIGKATTLYAGSLVVRDQAVLNAAGLTVKASAETAGGTRVVLSNGTLNSYVTFESGTSLQLAGANSATGTLTFKSGAGLSFDLSSATEAPLLTLTGTLVQEGSLSLSLAGYMPGYTYTLLTCTKSFDLRKWKEGYVQVDGGSFSDFTWNGNTLYFTVNINNPLVWSNAAGNGEWNAETANWVCDGDSRPYTDGLTVYFGNEGAGTVTLLGTRAPKAIVVENNAGSDYTFEGAGHIAGYGGLLKKGSGNLTISTENPDWTGGIDISAGTLIAGTNTAFGTGSVTMKGGTLDMGGKAIANNVYINADSAINGGENYQGSLTLNTGALSGGTILLAQDATVKSGVINNVLTGTGGITKISGGTLTLTGDNSYTGGTTITGGTLTAGHACAFGSGVITLKVGTLDLGGNSIANAMELKVGVVDARGAAVGSLSLGTLTVRSGNVSFYFGDFSEYLTGRSYIIATVGDGSSINSDLMSLAESGLASRYTFSLQDNKLMLNLEERAAATLTWDAAQSVWAVGADGDRWQTPSGVNDRHFHDGDSVVFSSSDTVTLDGVLSPSSVSVTGAEDVTLDGSGSLSGTMALNKSGSGTLTINTTNSYTGGTRVSGGTLVLGSTAALGRGSVSLSGGTLDLNDLDFSSAITATSGTLNGVSAYTGTLTVNGTVSMNGTYRADKLKLDGGTLSGGILTNTSISATGGTIDSIITGSSSLTSSGSVTLSGTNSYTGGTNITAGTLTAGNIKAFGTGTICLQGGTLNLGSKNVANAITATGGTLRGASAYTGTLTVNGTVSLSGTTQAGSLQMNGGTLSGGTLTNIGITITGGTISSVISGSSSVASSGTVTLSGTNTYTGSTNITAGTLTAGNNTAFGTGAIFLQDGTLNLGGYAIANDISATGGTLSGASAYTGALTVNGTVGLSGTNKAGSLQMNGSRLFGGTLTNTGISATSGTISSVIAGGSSVTSSGAVTLSGTNTYTGGTTITAGTLTAGNAKSFGTGAINMQGGTLNLGSYAIANAITATGGTLVGASAYTGDLTINGTVSLDGTTQAGSLTMKDGSLRGGDITNTAILYEGGSIANIITGSSSVTSSGSVTLRGANTYTGDTLITAGTLTAGNAKAFGTGTISLLDGTLNLDGYAVANDISAAGGTLSGASAYTGDLTINGDVSLDGTTKAGSLTVNGTVSLDGTAKAGSLTMNRGTFRDGNIIDTVITFNGGSIESIITGSSSVTSTGTVVLTGTNTYTGGTTITAGTLTLDGEGTLGYGTVMLKGGTLDLGGFEVGNAITATGGTLCGNSAFYGNLTVGGSVTLREAMSPGKVQVNSGTLSGGELYDTRITVQGATLSSTITGGSSVTTSGTVTISGRNSYTGGTSVTGGTLTLGNARALGDGGVSLASCTLNLNGYAAANDFYMGRGSVVSVSGGYSFAGTLNVNGGTLNLKGTLAGTVNQENGTINVTQSFTGNLNLNGGLLNMSTRPSGIYLGKVSTGALTTHINYGDLNRFLTGEVYTIASVSSASTIDGDKLWLINSNLTTGYHFTQEDGSLLLHLHPRACTLTWKGYGSSNTWATGDAGTAWTTPAGITDTRFHSGDTAVFTSSASVNISGEVRPAEVQIRGNNYVSFSGTGSIGGEARIIKNGPGTLYLNTNNTYTGGTDITSGEVIVSGDASLGRGVVELRGGILDLRGYAVANTILATSGYLEEASNFVGCLGVDGDVTLNNEFSAAKLEMSGGNLLGGNIRNTQVLATSGAIWSTITGGSSIIASGNVSLHGDNSYTGGTTIRSGVLQAHSRRALGTGAVCIAGGTLDSTFTDALTLTSLTLEGGTLLTNAGGISLSGDLIIKKSTRINLGDLTPGTYTVLRAYSVVGSTKLLNLVGASSGYSWRVSGGSLLLDLTTTVRPTAPVDPVDPINPDGSVWTSETNGLEVSFRTDGTVLLKEKVSPMSMEVSNSGDLTWDGSGSVVGATALTKAGSGTLTIMTDNTYSGGTTISSGTVEVGTDKALGTGTVRMDGGVLDMAEKKIANDIVVASEVVIQNGGSYSGRLSMENGGTISGDELNISKTATLNSGVVNNALVGNGGVSKESADTLTLNGYNTYTGTTTVDAGTLVVGVGGTIANSNVSVGRNGSLVLEGSVGKNVTIDGGLLRTSSEGMTLVDGQTLTLNGGRVDGNLATVVGSTLSTKGQVDISGDLTFGGGTWKCAAGSDLTVGGSVVLAETTVFDIRGLATNQPLHTLLHYDNLSGDLGRITLAGVPNVDYELVDTGTELQLRLHKNVVMLTWNGSKGTWATNGAQKWLCEDGTSVDFRFHKGTGVLFNSKATVTISGTVVPDSVEVAVNGKDVLTFSGKGSIAGETSLVMNGTGGLKLNATNLYTGGTTINSGTVTATGAASFGTGAIQLNGGTLNLGGKAVANSIEAAGGTLSGASKFNGSLQVDGALTISGTAHAAKLELAGGTISGGTLSNTAISIDNGTIGSAISGSSSVTVSGKATLGGSLSYTGRTLVESGADLTLAGSPTKSSFTLEGGTLRTSAAGLRVLSGKTLTTGGNAGIVGNLSMEGGGWTVSDASTLSVSGIMEFKKATTLDVVALDAQNGTYTLAEAGLLMGTRHLGLGSLSAAGRKTYSVAASGNSIQLQIAGENTELTWAGGKGTWQVAGKQMWNATGVVDRRFFYGDTVTFNSNATVTLSGKLAPAAVAVTDGNVTFSGSGSIAGSAALTKTGVGTLKLNATNTYTGGTIIAGGKVVATGASSFGKGGITLASGTLDLGKKAVANAISATGGSITNATAYKGELTVGGNLALGSGTKAAKITLDGGTLEGGSITDTALALNGGAVSSNISGKSSLTSTGDVFLLGSLSYTGATVVQDGTLTLAKSLGKSSVTINEGARLKVAGLSLASGQRLTLNGGTLDGNVTMNAKSTLVVNEASSVTGSLIGNGGTWVFGDDGALNLNGILALNKATTADLSALAHGHHTLMSFNGFSGKWSNLTYTVDRRAVRLVYALDMTDSGLAVDVYDGALDLTWSSGNGTWMHQGGKNWVLPTGIASDKVFYNGDSVLFSSKGTVTISGEVAPSAVTVTGSGATTFAGKGSITGSAALTKSGTGTLKLNATNAYAGGTNINGGKVVATGAASFGTGDITLTSGTLDLAKKAVANMISATGGTISNATAYKGDLTVDGAVKLGSGTKAGSITLLDGTISGGGITNTTVTLHGGTVSSVISGGSTVTVLGDAALNAANTYTGATYLNAGTVKLGKAGSLGKGTVYLQGGTLDMNKLAVANAIRVQGGVSSIKGGNAYKGTAMLNGGTLELADSLSGTLVLNGGTLCFTADGLTLGKVQTASLTQISVDGLDLGTHTLFTFGKGSAIDLSLLESSNGTLSLQGSSLVLNVERLNSAAAEEEALAHETAEAVEAIEESDITEDAAEAAPAVLAAPTLVDLAEAAAKTATRRPVAYKVNPALLGKNRADNYMRLVDGNRAGRYTGVMAALARSVDGTANAEEVKNMLDHIDGALYTTQMGAQVDGNRAALASLRDMMGYGQSASGAGDYRFALQATSATSRVSGGDDAPGYKRQGFGGMLMAERILNEHAVAGLSVGYEHADVKADKLGKWESDDTRINAHLLLGGKGWQSRTIAGIGLHEYDMSRNVLGYHADSTPSGLSVNFMEEIARSIQLTDSSVLEPFFRLESGYNKIGSVTESGSIGNAALELGKQHAWSTTLTLGTRYVQEFTMGGALKPSRLMLEAGVSKEVGSQSDSVTARHLADSESYRMTPVSRERWGAVLGGSILIPVSENQAVHAGAKVQLRNGGTEVNANAGYQIVF